MASSLLIAVNKQHSPKQQNKHIHNIIGNSKMICVYKHAFTFCTARGSNPGHSTATSLHSPVAGVLNLEMFGNNRFFAFLSALDHEVQESGGCTSDPLCQCYYCLLAVRPRCHRLWILCVSNYATWALASLHPRSFNELIWWNAIPKPFHVMKNLFSSKKLLNFRWELGKRAAEEKTITSIIVLVSSEKVWKHHDSKWQKFDLWKCQEGEFVHTLDSSSTWSRASKNAKKRLLPEIFRFDEKPGLCHRTTSPPHLSRLSYGLAIFEMVFIYSCLVVCLLLQHLLPFQHYTTCHTSKVTTLQGPQCSVLFTVVGLFLRFFANLATVKKLFSKNINACIILILDATSMPNLTLSLFHHPWTSVLCTEEREFVCATVTYEYTVHTRNVFVWRSKVTWQFVCLNLPNLVTTRWLHTFVCIMHMW